MSRVLTPAEAAEYRAARNAAKLAAYDAHTAWETESAARRAAWAKKVAEAADNHNTVLGEIIALHVPDDDDRFDEYAGCPSCRGEYEGQSFPCATLSDAARLLDLGPLEVELDDEPSLMPAPIPGFDEEPLVEVELTYGYARHRGIRIDPRPGTRIATVPFSWVPLIHDAVTAESWTKVMGTPYGPGVRL